jgi:hypothetical protein
VRVARETGQPVRLVARQSFALTLYTLWHLQQWARVASFEQQALQHHNAGLLAFAMHEPRKLTGLHERFVAEHTQTDRPRITVVNKWQRMRELLADHARLTPIEKPPA